jgi:hypothetical protein
MLHGVLEVTTDPISSTRHRFSVTLTTEVTETSTVTRAPIRGGGGGAGPSRVWDPQSRAEREPAPAVGVRDAQSRADRACPQQ